MTAKLEELKLKDNAEGRNSSVYFQMVEVETALIRDAIESINNEMK